MSVLIASLTGAATPIGSRYVRLHAMNNMVALPRAEAETSIHDEVEDGDTENGAVLMRLLSGRVSLACNIVGVDVSQDSLSRSLPSCGCMLNRHSFVH